MQRLRRLVARRSARWDEGRFVAEGPKLLEEALAAGAAVETVFIDPSAGAGTLGDLVERAASAGAEVVVVAAGVLARVADAVTPQAVTAVVGMVHVPVGAIADLDGPGPVVVTAGVADPGNAGTIVRSAAASGAAAVALCAGGVDAYNPKAVRASAGALFRVPVLAGAEVTVVLEALARAGRTRWGAEARGGRAHTLIDWTRPSALVVGSESHGLVPDASAATDGSVTVPMAPGSESLNAAMAATVICFEAARQRRSSAMGAA